MSPRVALAAIAALLCVGLAFAESQSTLVDAPKWPARYTLRGEFRVPYFDTRVRFEVAMDTITKAQRLSYYEGLDSFIYRFDTGKLFSVFPRIDTPTCQVSPLDSSDSYVEMLPTLDNRWNFKGYERNGQLIVWEWQETQFNFTNVYKFFVHRHNQHPARLHMRGFNFVLGSHPDEYVIDYHEYRPNEVDPTSFHAPTLCNHAKESQTLRSRSYALASLMGGHMVSRSSQPDGELPSKDPFARFVVEHKKIYRGVEEFGRRHAIFHDNLAYINKHNARSDVSYKLGVTQFADMELSEVQRVMNPRKFKTAEQKALIRSTLKGATHTLAPSGAALPASVNWVTAGAVHPPKDQGACGSCWTFGTAAALEGAWQIKTGRLVALSEQQILDCAWVDGGDSGCDGGFAEQGFEWILHNKGIATEKSYKYLMVDGYCRAHDNSAQVTITGYVNVTGGEEGLKEAVSKGPVAVAINASMKDFYYLQGPGIYSNPACNPNDRDHEVTVVGYGTENGQDYWLVKNSWGVIWGDKGYFKMARNKGNMCGIAAEARYPLV